MSTPSLLHKLVCRRLCASGAVANKTPDLFPSNHSSFSNLLLSLSHSSSCHVIESLSHSKNTAVSCFHPSSLNTLSNNDQMASLVNNCSVCAKPGKACSVCKNSFYCSRECQKADWKTHRMLCGTFKDFADTYRPTPDHKRSICFPEDGDGPKFIWLETYPEKNGASRISSHSTYLLRIQLAAESLQLSCQRLIRSTPLGSTSETVFTTTGQRSTEASTI